MSADNWTQCPRCKVKAEAESAAEEKRVAESYGKVSAARYIADLEALNSRKQADVTPETFREDFTIGVGGDGIFVVQYRGGCSECDLTYDYDYNEAVQVKPISRNRRR